MQSLSLAQGDFAALLRRYSVISAAPDVDLLLQDLQQEMAYREDKSARAIGFLADI